MKTLFLSLLSIVMILPFVSYADGDERPPLPEFRSREWQERQGERNGRVDLEIEAPGDPFVLRVGSPIFNIVRNDLRNKRDAGEDLTDVEKAILRVEEIEGVRANMLLVFDCVYEGYLNDRGLSGWKFYLYDQGVGWLEVVIEDGLLYPLFIPARQAVQTLVEIVNSVQSESVCSRFQNSGLAILDATTGTVYAAVDIFSELTEGDIARSVKAFLRVPLSATHLGTTVVTKVVRLPFDLTMSAVNSVNNLIENLFGDGGADEEEVPIRR